jgi:hypothetical protein
LNSPADSVIIYPKIQESCLVFARHEEGILFILSEAGPISIKKAKCEPEFKD